MEDWVPTDLDPGELSSQLPDGPPSRSVLTWWRKGELWTISLLTRTLIPSGGPKLMLSSKSNYFPEAPPPNTIVLGSRASTYEFGGDANIQSITHMDDFLLSASQIFSFCKLTVENILQYQSMYTRKQKVAIHTSLFISMKFHKIFFAPWPLNIYKASYCYDNFSLSLTIQPLLTWTNNEDYIC